MADQYLEDLDSITELNTDDLIYIVSDADSSHTGYKVSVSALTAFIKTLLELAISDVTNLQTTLDGKANKAGDTFTGPVAVPNGTVSAPSLRVGQDTQTGFYRAGSNILGLTCGGVLSHQWSASSYQQYTSTRYPGFYFRQNYDDAAGAGVPIFVFQRSQGSATTPLACTTGTMLGDVVWQPYTGSAYAGASAYIRGVAVQDHTATEVGTRLVIATAATGNQFATQTLAIEAGRLGINMGSGPTEACDVNGNIRARGVIRHQSYTVATLPTTGVSAMSSSYASNGRKSGEGSGAGTGVPVWFDGSNWKTYYDNTTVEA